MLEQACSNKKHFNILEFFELVAKLFIEVLKLWKIANITN